MQIAIDGPAGAGKSTVARALADAMDLKYLDTGALFRAVGYGLLERGVDLSDEAAVDAAMPDIDLTLFFEGHAQHVTVNGVDVTGRIRTEEVGRAASDVGRWPVVRDTIKRIEREFARVNDVVMDGRDIASVILPDADFKIYLTASARARALRRCKELRASGQQPDVDAVEKEIEERDQQDTQRAVAPLRHTEGEILVDTSDMTQAEVVDKLQSIVGKERA